MSNELLGLWEQTRPSVVFITHDLEEAVALADKVVVMTVGRDGQGRVRHRPAPAARGGPGDPLRAAISRTASPHLGVAAPGGPAGLRAHGSDADSEGGRR